MVSEFGDFNKRIGLARPIKTEGQPPDELNQLIELFIRIVWRLFFKLKTNDMKKIYKYVLKFSSEQIVSLPKDAKILSAQLQNYTLTMWALVSPDNEPEDRTIHIFGTGHDVPVLPLIFIDTVQEGNFVWHIFEQGK